MGQKVHPKSFRLNINQKWDSNWFAGKKYEYADKAVNDQRLREKLFKRFADCGISKIEIGSNSAKTLITIHTSKPGLIIGRQGTQIDEVKKSLEKKFGSLEITIKEIKSPELDAHIVGENIAKQIERRVAYRRAAKQSLQKSLTAGAKGVKIRLAGRLNGVEIARSEIFKEGNIPLHTLRSKIDYAEIRANTIYGVIGIKVWIYKGEAFKKEIKK
jgi:small subunit ribosomal protein S3